MKAPRIEKGEGEGEEESGEEGTKELSPRGKAEAHGCGQQVSGMQFKCVTQLPQFIHVHGKIQQTKTFL